MFFMGNDNSDTLHQCFGRESAETLIEESNLRYNRVREEIRKKLLPERETE